MTHPWLWFAALGVFCALAAWFSDPLPDETPDRRYMSPQNAADLLAQAEAAIRERKGRE